MLNWIWFALILISVLCAAVSGEMEAVTQASMDSAKKAVELAIGLVGIMAFWLGIMKVAEDSGLLHALARKIKPVMTRLFPQVPADHPAMSAMIMNISANMLGLGNAATPFGIKAMIELDRLNSKKGVATNAMCLFLAINTSNVALFPLGVIALRSSLGSINAAGIMPSTFVATLCSTLVAIFAAKFFCKLPHFRKQWDEAPDSQVKKEEKPLSSEDFLLKGEKGVWKPPFLLRFVAWISVLFFFGFMLVNLYYNAQSWGLGKALKDILSFWLLPGLIVFLLLYGVLKGVKVYESLVEGAKEGFNIAIRIIPFLVAIFVAVGMFRASGALDLFMLILNPVTNLLGMPAEALPMALLRPLSGSGAYGVMAEIMEVHGPDSFIGYLVSTFQGSTETTFYVLAVYFGAVQIKIARHALPVCLLADLAGILAAVWICRILFT